MFSTAGRYSAVVSGEDIIPEEGEEGPEQGGMERGEVSGSSTCTPPKANETRCVSIENKVSGVQQEIAPKLQLQANMVVTSATLLEEKLLCRTDDIEPIDITCYGLLVGTTYPLKLFKLNINFIAQEMLFGELFSLQQCPLYGAYADIALNYLCESVCR